MTVEFLETSNDLDEMTFFMAHMMCDIICEGRMNVDHAIEDSRKFVCSYRRPTMFRVLLMPPSLMMAAGHQTASHTG